MTRKVIYTTNAAENFHRQLREVTKIKGAFVSEGALTKMLCLTTIRASEKLTQPVPNRALTIHDSRLTAFTIYAFSVDRFSRALLKDQ